MWVREELKSQAGSLNNPNTSNTWEQQLLCDTELSGSKMIKNSYFWELLWELSEVLCVQHLELCLANMCLVTLPLWLSSLSVLFAEWQHIFVNIHHVLGTRRLFHSWYSFLFWGLCHGQVASHFSLFSTCSGRGAPHASFHRSFQFALLSAVRVPQPSS